MSGKLVSEEDSGPNLENKVVVEDQSLTISKGVVEVNKTNKKIMAKL